MDILFVRHARCPPNAAKAAQLMSKGKEQPEQRIHSGLGALRKTVGLSQGKCCEGGPVEA